MKVVCSYLSGRMGNQMFVYAFSRALKIAQGGNGKLVFNFKKVISQGTESDGFEDTLKYFNVEPYVTEKSNLVLKYGNILQVIVYTAYILSIKLFGADANSTTWSAVLRKFGMLFTNWWDDSRLYDRFLNNQRICDRVFLYYSGVIENTLYYDKIRVKLLEELTPKEPPLFGNKTFYDLIEQTNSVCVSVRRGDYLSPEHIKDFYVCDESYFRRAIEVAKNTIENPTLFFFSDDIEWVKEHIKSYLPSYYESGNSPVWEKMRLMYSCKHFIISNSTFAWWAQYLCRNTDKVVIAPDRWRNGEIRNNACRLLLDSFIKIPTR